MHAHRKNACLDGETGFCHCSVAVSNNKPLREECQLRFVGCGFAKFKNNCAHVKIILRLIRYLEPVSRRHLSAKPAQS